jgi:MOSC domain-containing protein YiiM
MSKPTCARIRLLVGRSVKGDAHLGAMAIVIAGGEITTGDEVAVEWPAGMHEALKPV